MESLSGRIGIERRRALEAGERSRWAVAAAAAGAGASVATTALRSTELRRRAVAQIVLTPPYCERQYGTAVLVPKQRAETMRSSRRRRVELQFVALEQRFRFQNVGPGGPTGRKARGIQARHASCLKIRERGGWVTATWVQKKRGERTSDARQRQANFFRDFGRIEGRKLNGGHPACETAKPVSREFRR